MVIRIQELGLETAEHASGVTCVNAGDGDILGNNCTSSDNYLVTDRYRENSGIRSDTDMVPNFCRPPELRLASRSASQKQVINKHCAMRNEAIVTDRDQVADERMRLNAASLSNGCSLLYLDERPDEGIITDVATV
jgi:hypothetical protein